VRRHDPRRAAGWAERSLRVRTTPAPAGPLPLRQAQLRRSHPDRPVLHSEVHRGQWRLPKIAGSFDTIAGPLNPMFDFSSPQGRNATLLLDPTTGQPAPSPQADLQVQVSAPLFAAKGQTVRANVTVTNHGPTTAGPLQITAFTAGAGNITELAEAPAPETPMCSPPTASPPTPPPHSPSHSLHHLGSASVASSPTPHPPPRPQPVQQLWRHPDHHQLRIASLLGWWTAFRGRRRNLPGSVSVRRTGTHFSEPEGAM